MKLLLSLLLTTTAFARFQDPSEFLDFTKYQLYQINDLNALIYVDDVPDSTKVFLKKKIRWEGNIGLIIEKYTKEGTLAIDIGAHIGLHTIAMSRKVGPQGGVIAFEPQKKMFYEQLANLEVNKCTNVLSLRKALGAEPGIIQMDIADPTNEGGTSIGKGGDFAEMITLDSLNLENVSLIKVDVEWYEYFVFLGARNTILRNRPIIVFEIMGEMDYATGTPEIKAQFERVIDLVASYGYHVHNIHSNDYIAFPKFSEDEVMAPYDYWTDLDLKPQIW
ncbi:MAG: FkbM family methyltransferase [Verrucomicrobia bacterium]|nr:FkbM family methyltransferase [Verrucomicrobiota bacterium]